jgi:hypothetical protein
MADLQFGGITANQVFSKLTDTHISEDDAKRFVASWVWENAFGVGRRFDYTHPFPAADPAPAPAPFVREFQHADWLDGESAVQAGQTPTEQGFNERFHRIERDLDRLGALEASFAAALAAMRSNVHDALEDVRAEMNRINADIADLRAGRGVSVSPVHFDPGPKFVGSTKFFDKQVQVWQTTDGRTFTIPTVEAVSLPPSAGATRAPKVAEMLGRDADIRAAFPAGVKAGDLVDKFGDRRTSDGQLLADVLAAVPADQTFPNLDAMVGDLADRDAALLRGIGADAGVRSTLGVAAGQGGTAPAGRVEGVSAAVNDALVAASIRTVSDLAAATPDRLTAAAAARGQTLSAAQAMSIIARARTFRQL